MYLLISVIEMEIFPQKFNTLESAQKQMRKEYVDSGGVFEFVSDGEAHIDEYDAYVIDGNNHDNYVWKIVKI